MITYEGFIHELTRLKEGANGLLNADRMHMDDGFRKWRNELDAVITQIRQAGYFLPVQIKVAQRGFGDIGGRIRPHEEVFSWYQLEMRDTIHEIETIIDSFKKHGEPKKKLSNSATNAELEPPQKITMSWIWKHMPIQMWATLTVALVSAFMLGTFIGQSKLYHDLMDKPEVQQSEDAPPVHNKTTTEKPVPKGGS